MLGFPTSKRRVMKILLTADWHIKLGQKNVPRDWQYDRYVEFFRKLNTIKADMLVVAGDIFDTPRPSLDEVSLFTHFLCNNAHKNTSIITGNHEMLSKQESSLDHLFNLIHDYGCKLITDPCTHNGLDFLPYNYLKRFPKCIAKNSDTLITHVRGAIAPHVVPEIDLELFKEYDTVLTGDLHHYHEQKNLLYPGSPLTTSFVRKDGIKKGIVLFDTNTKTHDFIDLGLPQLRREVVQEPELMVPTEFHHTVYELEADTLTLNIVANSDLLDKKINTATKQEASLDLEGKPLELELQEYLSEILTLDDSRVSEILKTFDEER